MNYCLYFDERALKEYRALDGALREQSKKKLEKVLANPRVEANRLRHPLKDCYKIKFKSSGYRLVYQVDDAAGSVCVIAIGKRSGDAAYIAAEVRL
ncbi:MAG: type II toxin-antitoxin system RelE family toxin [Enterovibrio sp.]